MWYHRSLAPSGPLPKQGERRDGRAEGQRDRVAEGQRGGVPGGVGWIDVRAQG